MLDFYKYAKNHNVTSSVLNSYSKKITALTPNIIEERQLNAVSMDVFSRLMMDRIIFIGTEIDDDVSNIIMAQLLFLENTDNTRDISIYINSPGGSVYSGLGIYDVMQYITPEISCVCTGMAASMAAILLCAGTKGKRYALKHSRVMIHQPLGGAEGSASDIEIQANQIKILKNELYDILAKHSNKTYEEICLNADRDYWMKSSEALEYGLIDDIL